MSVFSSPLKCLFVIPIALTVRLFSAEVPARVPIQVVPMPSIMGNDEWDWTHARTTSIGGASQTLVTTMSQTTKLGSHGYHDIYESVSLDGGRSWTEPRLIETLKRQTMADGYQVAPGDLWPNWHAQSNTVLVTGKTFNFAQGSDENFLREKVAYAVKSMETGRWGELQFVAMPENDHSGRPILAPNAGCNQPLMLSNGDLLLPIRYQRDPAKRVYVSIVARCRFDGETLQYVEHGTEHSIPEGRGFYEPSVTGFNGEYFLTLRADHSAFVTKGSDGTHFEPAKEWRFDDGSVLGSYNTQQHWVTVGGGLFLVYTRKGAENDHIFRHRAPLFIAQVDPKRLVVLRKTEQVLLPENDACLGNSGICRINENESWVTCGEVRVSYGKRKGENNRVLFARIVSRAGK